MYAFYRCACAYIAQTLLINPLGHTLTNDFIETTFTVERCQASALLNVHVSLNFSLGGQMNMLQVSSYTGQNPQTTNQESKTNYFKF